MDPAKISALSATSVTLLRQAAAGCEEAWIKLDKKYRRLIEYYARATGVNPELTQDIAQLVLIQLTESLGEFEHNGRIGAFRKFIRITTVRWAIDVHRKESRQMARKRESPVAPTPAEKNQ